MTDIDFDSISINKVFPKLDEQKTRRNVDFFLSNTLPRMMRISLQASHAKGADGHTGTLDMSSINDSRIVQFLYAKEVVRRTKQAIGQCSPINRDILTMIGFKRYTDVQCYRELGRSKSSYGHADKPQAYLEFADQYLLDDLHVYQAE